jgi:hypothetical protein
MIIYLCVVLVTSLPVLIGWTIWLRFNYLIAKRYGVAGLKATPAVALAFRPREWVIFAPRLRSPLAHARQRPLTDLAISAPEHGADTTAGNFPW